MSSKAARSARNRQRFGGDFSTTIRPPCPALSARSMQTARLSPAEVAAVSEGLRPHAAAVEALGYRLR